MHFDGVVTSARHGAWTSSNQLQVDQQHPTIQLPAPSIQLPEPLTSQQSLVQMPQRRCCVTRAMHGLLSMHYE